MSSQRFDRAYMEVAHVFAKLSYAERLKVGAVLVKDRQILAEGYNGTIAGMDNTCELEDGTTSKYVLHAEQNLLVKMAKSNNSSEGATLYVTHSPCPICAKLIAQAGVKRVVYETAFRDAEPIEFLKSCGVDVYQLNNLIS